MALKRNVVAEKDNKYEEERLDDVEDEKNSKGKNGAADRKRKKGAKTLFMLLSLMELLKQHSKKRPLTSKKAHNELNTKYGVNLHTIQRQLKALSKEFSFVKKQGKNPIGYYYEKTVAVDTISLTTHTALALKLAEAHLAHLLPELEMKHLEPVFKTAGDILNNEQGVKSYNNLLSRIAIHPRGFRLLPPAVRDGWIFDNAVRAIAESCRIRIEYQGAKEKKPRTRTIEPIGLVDRSGVYYITAREVTGGDEPKNWAVHRIHALEVLNPFPYPKEFNLKRHAREGNLNRMYSSRAIEVHLRFTAEAGAHLRSGESRISENQQIVRDDADCIEIIASVRDSDEFRWWILEKGAGCAVLAPASLRNAIRDHLLEALEHYANA